MCGIVGWVDLSANLEDQDDLIKAMTGVMTNRGPDAAGLWLAEHAAFGHRRLSVVDPNGGAQPMTRHVGNRAYTITYNGELYNTGELRDELKSLGFSFTTHSDTEILLSSFIAWGSACLQKLNGIYAFGIWSARDETLFLARDRLGVKPLFYTEQGTSFFFASEPKALLQHPAIRPEIDAEGLAEVFVLGPSRTPGHGVFRGIKELRPGCCLTFDFQGIRTSRYWSPVSRPHPDDLPTTAATVRELLQDSVERQMVADVPVCTFLSGGLDSSAISTFASRYCRNTGKGHLQTWSVDYRNNKQFFRPSLFQPNSDAPWVKKVSQYLASNHHYVTLDTPQLAAALVEATKARDLPGMADVDSSLLLFCREIKKKATVALSGECADEIFGGYPWFYQEDDLSRTSFPWLRSIKDRVRLLAPELIHTIRPEEYVRQRYRETLAEVPRLEGENQAESRRRELFYLNIIWFMTALLDRKDRMSMATGLEVRVPFCDHRLVEYVWNIPWSIKTWAGREKGILRLALQGTLPTEVLTRRKSPYPKTHNPSYLAVVKNWFQDILNDPYSPLVPLLDRANAISLLETPDTGRRLPWFGQLMGKAQLLAYLIQVDTWLREHRITVSI